MSYAYRLLTGLCCAGLLGACSTRADLAPITYANPMTTQTAQEFAAPADSEPTELAEDVTVSSKSTPAVRVPAKVSETTYHVLPGDSLYGIARRFSTTYQILAQFNKIEPPYRIYAGQTILIPGDSYKPLATKKSEPHFNYSPQVKKSPVKSQAAWIRPVDSGQVVKKYSVKNKGIDIDVSGNASVVAARAGKVVYCGQDIEGYGNLVIIKHDRGFLTAYAHVQTIVVKEGESVKQGQKIAQIKAVHPKTAFHFEIRHQGETMDPLKYIA